MKQHYTALMLFVAAIVLAGCEPAQPFDDNTPLPDTTLTGDIDTITGRVDQYEREEQRNELSEMDSPFSGYIQFEATIVDERRLDPRAYMDNEQEQERCQTILDQGEEPGACKADRILFAQAADGTTLPQELVQTRYNTTTGDIQKIALGCLAEEEWIMLPVRNFTGDTLSVINTTDKELVEKALISDEPVRIRIEKEAYDILGRGGTNCDIFFHRLSVFGK